MMSEEHYYGAKVWLKTYADAIECLKEAAEKEAYLKNYDNQMTRIIEASKNDEFNFKNGRIVKGSGFAYMKETRLYQYSNYIFKKYLSDFENYRGSYEGLKKIIDNAYDKMKAETE